MARFVQSEEFKKLNVGLALDEGVASANDVLGVFYGDRNPLRVYFICKGK